MNRFNPESIMDKIKLTIRYGWRKGYKVIFGTGINNETKIFNTRTWKIE